MPQRLAWEEKKGSGKSSWVASLSSGRLNGIFWVVPRDYDGNLLLKTTLPGARISSEYPFFPPDGWPVGTLDDGQQLAEEVLARFRRDLNSAFK
jgi:hypothetical protein